MADGFIIVYDKITRRKKKMRRFDRSVCCAYIRGKLLFESSCAFEIRFTMPSFCEQLQARVDAVDSLICVGLDPHIKELSDPTPSAAFEFCKGLIDATLPFAAAYKPNAAFFERFGAEGHSTLVAVLALIPPDVPVIYDAKRGDIGSTSEAYANAALHKEHGGLGAHCVTVNPYMGSDSLSPFLKDPTKGAFVLCKTSNPGSNELQTLPIVGAAGGPRKLYEEVARLAHTEWAANDNVGLVVGATDSVAIAAVRRQAPAMWLLCPGVGAQGGDLAACCAAGLFVPPFSNEPTGPGSGATPTAQKSRRATGLLFPVSRGLSNAPDPAVAARDLKEAVNAARAMVEAKAEEEEIARAAAASTEGGSAKRHKGDNGGADDVATAAAAAAALELAPYQKEFIQFATANSILKFGSFTLKSGRVSPYFFNAGGVCTGGGIAQLAGFYAQALVAPPNLPFDVLFGPAYKGIPLATAVGVALYNLGVDVGVCYNRKEAKDHGEGGLLVGADLKGKRVMIVDDVITAGTAIREAVALVRSAGGIVAGVVIALDRQEISGSPKATTTAAADAGGAPLEGGVGATTSATAVRESAVMGVVREVGCPVRAVLTLGHLDAHLSKQSSSSSADGSSNGAEVASAVKAYRSMYGV